MRPVKKQKSRSAATPSIRRLCLTPSRLFPFSPLRPEVVYVPVPVPEPDYGGGNPYKSKSYKSKPYGGRGKRSYRHRYFGRRFFSPYGRPYGFGYGFVSDEKQI